MPKYYNQYAGSPVCVPTAIYNLLQWRYELDKDINYKRLNYIAKECNVDLFENPGVSIYKTIAVLKKFFPNTTKLNKINIKNINKLLSQKKAVVLFIYPLGGDTTTRAGHVTPVVGYKPLSEKYITPNGFDDQTSLSLMEAYLRNRKVLGYVIND